MYSRAEETCYSTLGGDGALLRSDSSHHLIFLKKKKNYILFNVFGENGASSVLAQD